MIVRNVSAQRADTREFFNRYAHAFQQSDLRATHCTMMLSLLDELEAMPEEWLIWGCTHHFDISFGWHDDSSRYVTLVVIDGEALAKGDRSYSIRSRVALNRRRWWPARHVQTAREAAELVKSALKHHLTSKA